MLRYDDFFLFILLYVHVGLFFLEFICKCEWLFVGANLLLKIVGVAVGKITSLGYGQTIPFLVQTTTFTSQKLLGFLAVNENGHQVLLDCQDSLSEFSKKFTCLIAIIRSLLICLCESVLPFFFNIVRHYYSQSEHQFKKNTNNVIFKKCHEWKTVANCR